MPPTHTPRFLPVQPQGKDDLSSGSHEITADAIIEYIKQKHSPHLIGLNGQWGVGKSNVIGIIKNKLSKKYHVFIYDAWAHQEGLQRKSFLEELTNELIHNKYINDEKWTKKLDELLSKRKTTIQKTIPVLSYSVIVAFCAIVLSPISAAIARLIKDNTWQIIVACIPIGLSLIIWLIAICKNRENFDLRQLFYVYRTNELETVKTETVSENETTISEFRIWMAELSEALVTPIIIVFDNMDRLPADRIKSLWSSIHTFFSERDYENIWTLIPFDNRQIIKAFNDGDYADEADSKTGYIEKTFSVIMNITYPVLTDWQSFFEIKYQTAFSNSEEEDYLVVKSTFNKYTKTITPRKIISFLNELVSLKIIWKDTISIRYMALFVLNKDKLLADPIKQILNNDYLQLAPLQLKQDNKVSENIAALAFNVKIEDALQITLLRETEIRIREVDEEKLIELTKYPGFIVILENVVTTTEWEIEPMTMSLDIILQKSEFKPSQGICKQLWQIVANKQTETAIDLQEFTASHKILLLQSEQYELGDSLFKHLLKQFEISRNFKGSSYFYVLEEMNEFCMENNLKFNITTFVQSHNLLPEQFLDYAATAKDDLIKYKVSCDFKALELILINKLTEATSTVPDLSQIKNLYTFNSLKGTVYEMITDETINHQNISKVFELYSTLFDEFPLHKQISDARIHTLLETAIPDSEEYVELAAMRLARILDFPDIGGVSKAILSTFSESLPAKITKIIHRYITYNNLLSNSISQKHPLMIKTALATITSPASQQEVDIIYVLQNYEAFLSTFGISNSYFLEKLNSLNHKVIKKLTVGNFKSTIINIEIITSCIKHTNPFSDWIVNVAKEYINSISEVSWNIIFCKEEEYELSLLFILITQQSINELSTNCNEGLNNYLQEIESQQEVKNITRLQQIFSIANQEKLSGTVQNIRDAFINSSNITFNQFMLIEPLLRNLGKMNEKPLDVVRTILNRAITWDDATPIIFTNSNYYIQLLVNAKDGLNDLIKFLRTKIELNTADLPLISFCTEFDHSILKEIEIIRATYGTFPDHVIDITENIQEKIESEKTLHFRITNDIAGNDPDYGNLKRLEIIYKWNGKSLSKSITEGEWLSLP